MKYVCFNDIFCSTDYNLEGLAFRRHTSCDNDDVMCEVLVHIVLVRAVYRAQFKIAFANPPAVKETQQEYKVVGWYSNYMVFQTRFPKLLESSLLALYCSLVRT